MWLLLFYKGSEKYIPNCSIKILRVQSKMVLNCSCWLQINWLLTESGCSTTIIFAEVTISFQWRHIDTTSNSSNSNKYNACSQWNIDLHRICFTDSKTNFIQCIPSNNRPLHWFPRGDHHHGICFIFAAHYFTFLHFLK